MNSTLYGKTNTERAISTDTQRDTIYGPVIGFEDDLGYRWTGIPYAKRPIKNLRWKRPQKPFSRKYTLQAIKDHNPCVQVEIKKKLDLNSKLKFVGNENCLVLNITSPKVNPKKLKKTSLLPVMVWIHGGGNTSGEGADYNFSEFVKRKNIIVVTINYRLGVFGFFSHPSLFNTGTGLDKTSNFALLDIVAALEWVRDNIRFFGGNPKNVTIFGESAGAHNVYSLMVMPQAKGLFHKAISQSGYFHNVSIAAAQGANNKIKDKLTFNQFFNNMLQENETFIQSLFPSANINQLNDSQLRYFLDSATMEMIMKGYKNDYRDMPLLVNDGITIPLKGVKASFKDKNIVANVPVIVGSNRDEATFWTSLNPYFIKNFTTIKQPDVYRDFVYFRSENYKITGSDHALINLSESQNENLYQYRFDWDEEYKSTLVDMVALYGASHAFEIPFISGDFTGENAKASSYIYPKSNLKSRYVLMEQMMTYWSNFAKTGTPNDPRLPEWPLFMDDNGHKQFLILDSPKDKGLYTSDLYYTQYDLFDQLMKNSVLNKQEKCTVLWFNLIENDPNLLSKYYDTWNDSICRGITILQIY